MKRPIFGALCVILAVMLLTSCTVTITPKNSANLTVGKDTPTSSAQPFATTNPAETANAAAES